MRRLLFALALSFAGCGTSLASDQPDRSALSYEENAIINEACATALKQGVDAFHGCVAQQLAALQTHPTPDRSGVTAVRNRAIEKDCGSLRRAGIARYNDCVRAALAGPQNAAESAPDDGITPNFTKMFVDDAKLAVTPAATAANAPLLAPFQVLPKRPDRLGERALAAAELYKKVERAVFVVLASPSLAEARVRNILQGSAVAISPHLLLTNCHVVKDRPLIRLAQEAKSVEATLVAADIATDRCVLKTDEITLTPIAGVRPFESLNVGERVFAVGTPHSLERTLSEGLISGLRPERNRNFIQTSAPLSPGSSGGGLFDERGNLIGITTLASLGGAQNLNFAIAAADYWR